MTDLLLRSIQLALPRFTYRFGSELEFQAGIAQVLTDAGVPFEREFVAGPGDRFDFLCAGRIVIEAKTRGAMQPALRQCVRYLERPDVSAVVLATTRHWGRVTPRELTTRATQKPIKVLSLRGASF